jgi:hypothetical protein
VPGRVDRTRRMEDFSESYRHQLSRKPRRPSPGPGCMNLSGPPGTLPM